MSIEKILDKFDAFGYMEHQYPLAIGLWKEEQKALVESLLQCDPNKDWLEIGSFMGGSAVLMCLAKREVGGTGKVVSVDLDFSLFSNSFNRNVYRVGKFGDIHECVQTSSWNLKELYNRPLSFGFIDGWHSFKGVLKDFQVLDPLIEEGIIAFHDTAPQPYKQSDIDKYSNMLIENEDEYMKEILPGEKFDSVIDYHEAEKKQNFAIDEVIMKILQNPQYQLVKLRSIAGQTHFDRAGNQFVRGRTSPFPAFVAIKKEKKCIS